MKYTFMIACLLIGSCATARSDDTIYSFLFRRNNGGEVLERRRAVTDLVSRTLDNNAVKIALVGLGLVAYLKQ